MLNDFIKDRYNTLIEDRGNGHFSLKLRGKLEVFGHKKGKLFHYDESDNTITIWAKHATMHTLTGDVFSSVGTTRLTGATDHVTFAGDTGRNTDGTLVSSEQYFSAPTWPGTNDWWSRPASGDSLTHLYPYFPSKMLFGTGFEWRNWEGIDTDIGDSTYTTVYAAAGWNETIFNNNSISNAANNYSNEYSGDTLHLNRSMNDIYSTVLTTPAITDTSFGVRGAIKNGLYHNEAGDSGNIEAISGNYFPKKEYWGVGRPAFIYAKREARFYQSGAEVALNYDSTVENKITYTINMPEQTGSNAGIYYPYNGFILKEAGLFCDAKFILRNTTPPNDAGSDDTGLTEYNNYTKMAHGIMFAKRYMAPITKSHDVSITARWSIYL